MYHRLALRGEYHLCSNRIPAVREGPIKRWLLTAEFCNLMNF